MAKIKATDFANLAKKIERVLEAECDEFAAMGETDVRGGSWTYVLDGSVSGFIGCEDNSEDIKIDTVTISVAIGDMASYGIDDLYRLLETNGHFFEVGFTATKLAGDDAHSLFLQRRIPAELYDAGDFREHVNFMLEQLRLFVKVDF